MSVRLFNSNLWASLYSVKIILYRETSNKIRINYYKLEILNDVDEMIKSKMDNHDYNLIDSNNIFKCDKNNLEKLIIKYEKKTKF